MQRSLLPLGATELESRIFKLLLAVNDRYKLNCTLRVAGGWVRDRMLRKVSNDIDVALEGDVDGKAMTGEMFASYITKYQVEHDMETHHVGVIKVNPEQSKHLETATTHIFGEAIDLVNLRAEDYADSRIPVVRPGTPLEDARRRDLTINALFYNLHTEEVEDFTSGLVDLEKKVVRTPLDPSITFHDDPLRLLRCVRFAARFDCEVHGDIVQAARDKEIHESLKKKVSRERVGIELKKMLTGPSPGRCLKVFHDFGIYDVIFESCKCDKKGNVLTATPVGFTEEEWNEGSKHVANMSDILGLEGCIATMLLNLDESKLPNHPKLEPFLQSVITNGLKLSRRTTEVVLLILNSVSTFTSFWKNNEGTIGSGRELPEEKGWELDLDHLEGKGTPHPSTPLPQSNRTVLTTAMQQAILKYDNEGEQIVQYYWKQAAVISSIKCFGSEVPGRHLIQQVKRDELLSALPDLKPCVKGDVLMTSLKINGKDVREAYKKQLDFQVEFPSANSGEILAFLSKVV
eukprot:TRINITY_DN11486_c0_g2_i1.p1 TRINITY_DN11486_c0_g2~~TRINITY_DN11486_c0_g2_i1.p1  ORF type:complete len:543 (+),score=73.76 TRINITY_DN11486_c0_g2_i1:79-1629(+)